MIQKSETIQFSWTSGGSPQMPLACRWVYMGSRPPRPPRRAGSSPADPEEHSGSPRGQSPQRDTRTPHRGTHRAPQGSTGNPRKPCIFSIFLNFEVFYFFDQILRFFVKITFFFHLFIFNIYIYIYIYTRNIMGKFNYKGIATDHCDKIAYWL